MLVVYVSTIESMSKAIRHLEKQKESLNGQLDLITNAHMDIATKDV